MKVKFKCDCEVEIVERLNRQGEPVWGLPEIFLKGTEIEFDLIGHPERFRFDKKTALGKFVPDKTVWDVQFGDGTMGMGLSRSWFTIIKTKFPIIKNK
jgi:hypothetical protein